MNNIDYVVSLGIGEDAQQRCLEVMEKYGENKWWEPDVDPRKLAYYQMLEPIMLGEFSHFHEAMELLLGRPVYRSEFGLSAEKLRQEAERAWQYQVGVTSDVERKERVLGALQELEEFARREGKQVIRLSTDEDQGE